MLFRFRHPVRERLADAARYGGVIARVEQARGFQPGSTVDPREVDGVPGARCKLLRILERRTPVALAEREGMVNVALCRTGAFGELVRPRSPETARRHDAVVNFSHAGRDEPTDPAHHYTDRL
ncbi:MAG: hypothetical protein OXC10_20900 [Rhodospirillaceae bacterium]|nr:hypothetical protein [Rhodospirillaceae bacterium]